MKNSIYLAGLPRGGTTLVSSILGQHSKLEQVGESMYSGCIDPNFIACSCGRMPCEYWLRVCEEINKFPEIRLINFTYGIIDKMREPYKVPHKLTIQTDVININQEDLASLVTKSCDSLDKLMLIFRRVVGDYIFIDNTKEIFFAEELVNRFNWKIILITRDPRGMALSSRLSGERHGVPRSVESKIPVYLDFAKRAIILKNSSNVFSLKYEDLCKNTEIVIRRLCSFLEIEFELDMLYFKRVKGHTLMGNRMRHNSDENICEDLRWKKCLTKIELDLIRNNVELVELYHQLNYKID